MAALEKRMLRAAFFGVVIFILGLYFLAIFSWMLNWGATRTESSQSFPGDELGPDAIYRSTRAITIDAPVEAVWPWIAQLGQDRAGFYSYAWVENMLLADIHNAWTVNPKWQERREGEILPLTSPRYPLGLVKRKERSLGPYVRVFEPRQAMVLEGWGSFVLQSLGAGRTRLIVRDSTRTASLPVRVLWQVFFDPVHFAMERQMMKGIKARAEGRLDPGGVVQSLATTGFILTALSSGVFVAFIRRKWPWIVAPLIYAAVILMATSDPQAALVGFTAVSLIIAGCLYFRGWGWAYLLFMFIFAHIGLLIPWDAYTAFGLIFLFGFLLFALGVLSRSELASSIPSREEARRKAHD